MPKKLRLKYLILLVLTLYVILPIYSQREQNYIYLFDCTGSMKTNKIWDAAQKALDGTISKQTTIPTSQFIIIPFGDHPEQPIHFSSSEYINSKTNIEKAFNTYIGKEKFTRITDVLNEGFKKIDPNKENKIYLLTDGQPNNGDTAEKVAQTIKEWCGNHRNCRLFYVALTKSAVNPTIKKAIDDCSDAFIVECESNVIPQIADISSDIYTNLAELTTPKTISFSLPGDYGLKIISNDSLFNVSIDGNKATEGKIIIRISPKDGMALPQLHQKLNGEDYIFGATIQCSDQNYFIANPNINIHVYDGIPSRLTLAGGVEQLPAEGAKWYDSFLWSESTDEKKISWDLTPEFQNNLTDTEIKLKFSIPKGSTSDFQAWYNQKPIKVGDVVTISPNKPAVLEVMFNHDAATGKRYFELLPAKYKSLDMVNEVPISEYQGTSLRTEYHVGWNPLKTFLFWLLVVLIGVLILWFVILKRIFFPKIQMSRVEFTGPGSYYVSKRLRGARKIVFSDSKKKQNFLSLVFTGKVRCVRAGHFQPALIIEAAPGHHRVKIRNERNEVAGWDIYPSTTFGQYETGYVINKKTNEKSNITFS